MRTFMQFLTEVTRDQLALVGSRINKFTRRETEDEPFNDVFGEKSRVVIPLMNPRLREFMELLTGQGLTKIDLKEGTGIVTVTTNQGSKERKMKIGRFLQVRSQMDKARSQTYTDWIEWWAKEKPSLDKPAGEDYSIVVSRHPIDIIRMSDHPGMGSCHSPGKQFWQCAVQEAKTGGGVAYVVRNRDLAKVKNLQAKDIFADKKRDVTGITPLSRLRLRRYEDDENDYLVPIMKSYGGSHSGFYESLRAWALSEQMSKLQNVDYNSLRMKGGSYEDYGNTSPDIWSEFLGKSFSGHPENVDQDEEEEKMGNGRGEAETRVRAVMQEGNERLKKYGVHGSVEDMGDDDNQWYVSYGGGTEFEFTEYEFVKDLPRWSDNEPNIWKIRREIQKEISKVCDIWGIEEIEFTDGDTVRLSLSDHDSNGTVNEFERFIDQCERWDRDYDEHKKKIAGILREHGFIRNPVAELQLQHLKVSGDEMNDDGEWEVNWASSKSVVGSLEGMSSEQIMINPHQGDIYDTGQGFKTYMLNDELKDILEEKIAAAVPMPAGLNIACSLKAHETHVPKSLYGDEHFLGTKPFAVHGDVPVEFELELFATDPEKEHLQAVTQIDGFLPRIVEIVKEWWDLTMQDYTTEAAPGQEAEHPAIKASILRIQDTFKRLGQQQGTVTLKNGQYWFTEPEGGIDMPVESAFKKMKADVDKAAAITKEMQNVSNWSGGTVVKYRGGQPTFWWYDREQKNFKPIEDAIEAQITWLNGHRYPPYPYDEKKFREKMAMVMQSPVG
jgi:hypothetical protein